jgi:hypothetical protein
VHPSQDPLSAGEGRAEHRSIWRSRSILRRNCVSTIAIGTVRGLDKLDGPGDKDQGIERNGKANFVPATPDGMVFRRTPQEVLRVVYLTDKAGVDSGGFYPKGMNGTLKST